MWGRPARKNMGFFDFLKPKLKKNSVKKWEKFTLFDEEKGIWVKNNEEEGVDYYVKGNFEKPDWEQVKLIENIEAEIQKLDTKINEKMIFLYQNEKDLQLNFTHWREKFFIFAYQIHQFEKDHIVWEFAMSKNYINEPDMHLDFIFMIENGEIKEVFIDE